MNNKIKKISIYTSLLILYFVFFDVVSAADLSGYTLLEPLPGVPTTVTNFGTYLSSIFKLAVSLAAVLAVLQLSLGGFKYITQETFTGKSDAKEKIMNALYGLILILVAFLLLKTINSDLVKNDMNIPCVGTYCEDVNIPCVGASCDDMSVPAHVTIPAVHGSQDPNVIPMPEPGTYPPTFDEARQQEGQCVGASCDDMSVPAHVTIPDVHESQDPNVIPPSTETESTSFKEAMIEECGGGVTLNEDDTWVCND